MQERPLLLINEFPDNPHIGLQGYELFPVSELFIQTLLNNEQTDVHPPCGQFWHDIFSYLFENNSYNQEEFLKMRNLIRSIDYIKNLYPAATTDIDFKKLFPLMIQSRLILQWLAPAPEDEIKDFINTVLEGKGVKGLEFFFRLFHKLNGKEIENLHLAIDMIANDAQLHAQYKSAKTDAHFQALEDEVLARKEFDLTKNYFLPNQTKDEQADDAADLEVATILQNYSDHTSNLFKSSNAPEQTQAAVNSDLSARKKQKR